MATAGHDFLMRTARTWFANWSSQDFYQIADVIYDWFLALFKQLGFDAVLEFVHEHICRKGRRFFPMLVAILRFVKAFKMDANGRVNLLMGDLAAAARVIGARAHALALEFVVNGRIRHALDLAKFDEDCVESDALAAKIMGDEAEDNGQWERLDDGEDSGGGEFALFEPITPPTSQGASAICEEDWAEPIEEEKGESLDMLMNFPAAPADEDLIQFT
jgi:hypothetical protein